MNHAQCRQVLDCASPLALLEAARVHQRQRTAAVQDTAALAATSPRTARFTSGMVGEGVGGGSEHGKHIFRLRNGAVRCHSRRCLHTTRKPGRWNDLSAIMEIRPAWP